MQSFQELMKGNIIDHDHLEFYLTDEELYVMTLKRYFKYASGVDNNKASMEELKYWLTN